MRAEAAARQLGQLSLEHALRLMLLYAEKEPAKYERAALRWLSRYVTEAETSRCSRLNWRCRRWPSFEPGSANRRPSFSRSWRGDNDEQESLWAPQSEIMYSPRQWACFWIDPDGY